MRKYILQTCKYIPKRPRLTASWRKLHKTYSVNLSMHLAALSVAQEHWPQFQSFIPGKHFATVSLVLAVLITVLRYVDQPSLSNSNKQVNGDQDGKK